MISAAELHELQAVTDGIYVDPKIREYAVGLATATRHPEEVGLERLRRYISLRRQPARLAQHGRLARGRSRCCAAAST